MPPADNPSAETVKVRPPKPEPRIERAFDFTKYPQRHIVLRIAYHGHNHEGLAKQDHTINTVEGLIVQAMQRVRLVPESGPEKFSRCGRTDKGVSALGNAISLMVRAEPEGKPPLDYCGMINNCLPPTIRVVSWSFVSPEFDARFSCKNRTYRYYFLNQGLDLERMQKAANYLVGEHYFRNFCKLDAVNVDNFDRDILSVQFHPSPSVPGGLIQYCEIKGRAFLYHQIRCTMTVLFLVGRGLEEPEVVKALLERGDAKPTYPLADDSPLILWDCGFDPAELNWHVSHTAMEHILLELQDISVALLIRGAAAADMLNDFLVREKEIHFQEKIKGGEQQQPPSSVSSLCKKNGEQQAVVSTPVVEVAREVAANWESTGCDWTSVRLQPLLRRKRHHEMFAAKKSGNMYVPLLERDVETSLIDKVNNLSGSKKARHEVNQSKKRADRDQQCEDAENVE